VCVETVQRADVGNDRPSRRVDIKGCTRAWRAEQANVRVQVDEAGRDPSALGVDHAKRCSTFRFCGSKQLGWDISECFDDALVEQQVCARMKGMRMVGGSNIPP
jgi:hypothetical protein